MLTISTLKHHELAPSDQAHAGKNRFECRTCPYQMILDRRYYERKNMETKGAEDVLGGAESWKNVDKTEGMRTPHAPLGRKKKPRSLIY